MTRKKFSYFFHKNNLVHNRYVCCSCYKTQICYTNHHNRKVYACHCNRCIADNNIYSDSDNNKIPVICVNMKKYEIHNELSDEHINIKWKKSSLFSRRGYCHHCNDLLIIDYYFTQYIHDKNIVPNADLFCSDSQFKITDRHYNNWINLLFFHYFISTNH